jgi:MFS family permease
MFLGSWLSGAVVEHYAIAGGGYEWRSIWIFSAIASLLVLMFFLPSFPKEKEDSTVAVEGSALTN